MEAGVSVTGEVTVVCVVPVQREADSVLSGKNCGRGFPQGDQSARRVGGWDLPEQRAPQRGVCRSRLP